MLPDYLALLVLVGETRRGYGDGKEEGNEGQNEHLPEQVLEGRDGGRFATVILVAVDVQHSFTADGEHAWENALFEAGAEHDRVVFFIHFAVWVRRAGFEEERDRR